jgi:energy-coupling factor transporter ATP-binding protein EcfA2
MKPVIPSTPVSAPHDILVWSANRPDWQKDALRRILTNGTVTKEDIQELEQLCRYKHITPKPGVAAIQCTPLDSRHVPPNPGSAASVSLVSLSNLQNVNRLPSNQVITLGSSPGLTVVYGDNGSGKSGYARVIKKACRTRGALPEIRPDAFAPVQGPASGDIGFHIAGASHKASWKDGVLCDSRLFNVFVFDSSTADNYLEQDGPATFTPHGLDVLPKLSKTCDAINENLKKSIADLRTEISTFTKGWRYSATTGVGKLLNSLSSTTTTLAVNTLAGNNEQQSARLVVLTETLKSDPKKKAKETRSSKDRLNAFAERTKVSATALSDLAASTLKTQLANANSTLELATKFASEQFSATDLPGTRDVLWRKLWEAARIYSTSLAYKDKDFPVTEEALCLLCQHPLNPEAVLRLKAYDAFCKDQSQKLAGDAANLLKESADKIELTESLAADHAKIESDLAVMKPDQILAIVEFVKEADTRLIAFKKSLKDKVWTDTTTLPTSPAMALEAVVAELEQRAKTEESAEDPKVRAAFQTEREELVDREWLGRLKNEVLGQIERYKQIKLLELCQKDVNTTTVTSKNSELTKLLVTDQFCKKFRTETENLGLRTLEVKLEDIKGSKGETKFGLRFESNTQYSVTQVASEGEQRCIALAAFLAELSQASHNSALVFDDPVSSLDHFHREKIAVRLFEESKIRQVVVFTHDSIFLNDLNSHAGDTAKYLFLDWNGSQPGWCYEGLPWDCKSPEDRLDKLGIKQRDIAKNWGLKPSQDDVSKMREAYGWLRATIERIVERVVFADVVFRFRSYIKLKDLNKVVGFTQVECDEINRLFKICCEVTEAHDPAQGKQASTKEPKDLKADIDATTLLLSTLRARQKLIKPATSKPTP